MKKPSKQFSFLSGIPNHVASEILGSKSACFVIFGIVVADSV
jgi:hypothetical protein